MFFDTFAESMANKGVLLLSVEVVHSKSSTSLNDLKRLESLGTLFCRIHFLRSLKKLKKTLYYHLQKQQ